MATISQADGGFQAAGSSLIGLDEKQLVSRLGRPDSERDAAPGKIWQYRNGGCTVDLELYPDVRTRAYHALAYEVKSDDDNSEGKRLCLAKLESGDRSK